MKVFFIAILLAVGHNIGVAQNLPVPQGLKAEIVKNGPDRYIHLCWDKDQFPGSSPLGYNLLVKFPHSSSLLLYQKAGVIYDTAYQFPVRGGVSSVYEFALMSITNFPTVKRSKASAAIKVTIPSTVLPNIEIIRNNYQNGRITLGWEYDTSIKDLKGYIIYLDNEAIGSVNDPDQMSWSGEFTEEGNYIFEISAITASGLESLKSQKRVIKIK